MPFEEIILGAIADAVFGYLVDKGGDRLGDWAREKLGRDATKKAFKAALGEAFDDLKEKHRQWVEDYFDLSFFQHKGAPVLAQFLLIDGCPDASELASLWTDYLNMRNPERRAFYTRELEPVAADFLEALAHRLKAKEALRELHNSRAFEQMNEALQALRALLGAEKATYGTRRDYLRWLIARNLYLDPRGTFQTQRQVQVKLDEVYISLQAQRDETPGTADRHALEKELADLEISALDAGFSAEDVEDRRDQLHARFDRRLTSLPTDRPGEVLELSAVVTRHDRVVILGDPGSGKTTLLRYLALKHAEALWQGRPQAETDLGVARFPILIRIAEYAEDGNWKKKSLSDFLPDSYMLHDCPRSGLADLLQKELEKGNCLVLLDGLDEIVSADERLGVVKQIEDFVRRHAGKANRFVVTSRKAGYRSVPLAEPFVHYAVQDMDQQQMQRFLNRWCAATEDAQTPDLPQQQRREVAKREVDSLMKAIKTAPGVRRLATNPLLLRTLALIHRTGAQLPQKRIELYKLAADTLARTWRTAQGVPEAALIKESNLIKEEYLTPLLSKLAYWLHLNKPTGLATEREVYAVLGEEWARLNDPDLHWDPDDPSPKIQEEVRKFLVAVREHTGLFLERAPRRYGFMHLTFEEYYAARHLVARSRTRAKLIRQHLHQLRWQEPILLALGFIGLDSPADASELLETAILAQGEEARELSFTPSPNEDLLARDYLFALRCLGDNIPVRPRLLKQLIERLADEYLHGNGLARFTRYQKALRERLNYLSGSEGALLLIPLLRVALKDEDIDVRHWADLSLKAVEGLKDEDADVQRQVAQSQEKAAGGSEVAIRQSLAALKDRDTNVRCQAAESLGRIAVGNKEAIRGLLAALRDQYAVVRIRAAESLERIAAGDEEVIRGLLAMLKDEEYHTVRSQATRSLEQVGVGSQEAIRGLLAILKGEDADARRRTAESLGQIGGNSEEVVRGLVTALQDEEASVRYQAVVSLGLVGEKSTQVITMLIEALSKAEDWHVRLDAARLLGQIGRGDKAIFDALWNGLLDEVDDVRSACAQALVQLSKQTSSMTQELEARLLQAIDDPMFGKLDYRRRPATNYVYDALWLLLVGEGDEEDEE
jgi:HEAT repeat protein